MTALASASAFGMTAAAADVQAPSAEAESAGHGHGLWIDGLGLDVASTASTSTEFPDVPGPATNGLDLELLQSATVNANGINLPLLSDGTNGGLLALGDLGALSSFSTSPSATSSIASSGIITEEGAIDLGPVNDPDSFAPAQLDASALVRQVLGDAVADELLNEATLSVGALASRVEAENGAATSEYSLSGLDLELSSPAVGGLVDDVDALAGGLLVDVEALLAEGGTVNTLVSDLVDTIDALPLASASLNGLGLDTTELTTELRAQLLQTPLENSEGSVSVDLSDGTITVALDELAVSGQPGESLSSLAPNTDVLSGPMVNAILDGVSDALLGDGPNSLVTKAVTLITEGVYGVGVTADLEIGLGLDLGLTTIDVAGGSVLIEGTLGGILGQEGYDPLAINASDVTLLPGLPEPVDLGDVLQPVLDLITPVVSSIGAAILPVVTTAVADIQPSITGLLNPIVTELLDDALEPVLTEVLAITINQQPDTSDLGADGFTVRALSLTLLPLLGDSSVNVQLGSASAFAEAAAATLAASPNPVVQGGVVTLTGTGFTEDEDVTVTFPDGTTEVVVAGAGGSVTATWDVPEDYAPGTVNFSAAGGTSGLTATASTQVVAASAATLDAAPDPVEQGGTVTLTGGGYEDGEDVSITLPDGVITTVTAEDDGTFTTTWAVPANFPVGAANFSATGVTSELTAAASVQVEAAAAALLEASPNPVAQGGTVTLAGGGFEGSEGVLIELPDGTTTTVTANEDGAFSTTWVVPDDFAEGDATFTATGLLSERTATATTEVVAAVEATLDASPNPVLQGGTVTLTGGGFASGEDVTVTLPDGTTRVVPAELDGSISTTWEVPSDFATGTATFTALGEESGATATATTEVEAAPVATLEATPNPVEQGGTVTLTGGGFTDGENVTVVFPDGTEEIVVAGEDGSITTTWEVPADFEPGEATFTATGETSELTATATTVVEAAADADVNANASASASASADAAADDEASASAQAAAQAAANADNTSDASAAADVTANAAAEVAATADASSEASA
ncbi:choice-of-anchor G family protein, partial [Leucobacter sp. NPDC077196]|uniref:choice-of-anchor G family protein n=1 Tax=Leucobacter sp. NPDC077196 TaxID=3154959 RepID=UPI00343D27E6